MAQAQLRPSSYRTSTVVVVPVPSKILKIEAISTSGDAATQVANALDLNGDSVPDQLRCPICEELPLCDLIQCHQGHPICLECQLKSGKWECFQCRTVMKSAVGGEWIRNRMVEDILDAMRFNCPFRKNGCQETLSRGEVRNHKECCRFGPDWAQICKYFKNGASCKYWTQTAKPKEALDHLKKFHLDALYEACAKFCFDVSEPKDNVVKAIVTRKNGATFLTIAWSDMWADNISFACIRMDKPTPGQVAATKVKLTLERQNPRPRFKLTLPIVSLWEAPGVLEYKPSQVSRPFLKKYLLQHRAQDAEPNRNNVEDEEDAVQANVWVSIC